MPSFNKLIEMGKGKIFNFSKDPANMLLWTATAGWILSAAGQLASILTNKKISKKEKRFLVPQESADAFINIVSFFIVTKGVQNASKLLVSSGKVLTPRIKDFCTKYGIKMAKDGEGKVNIGKEITTRINDYDTILKVQKSNKDIKLSLPKEQIDELEKKVKILKHFKAETYGPFENGISVTGNIIGGVISGNIITPMLRNPMAAYKQKTSIEREKLEHDAKMYNENKVILAQNQVGQDKYRSSVNPYPTSGSLKI